MNIVCKVNVNSLTHTKQVNMFHQCSHILETSWNYSLVNFFILSIDCFRDRTWTSKSTCNAILLNVIVKYFTVIKKKISTRVIF